MDNKIGLNYAIASDIWELIEDEGEANKGYTAFLAKWMELNCLNEDEVLKIKEIISEEIKHINILVKIAEDLTGIKPEE